MKNSLKAGIISSVIAGFISILVYEISSNAVVSMGLYDSWWEQFATGNILVNIPLMGFWSIIFGIIYSKTYNLIPKKGIWKGLVFGLFLWTIQNIRIETYSIAYGLFLSAAGNIFAPFFSMTAYGLLLGFLYEFLSSRYYPIKEKKKIVTYDMSSGLFPGAIAGFCGGIAAGIVQVFGHVTGYWGITVAGEIISTIDFWWSQVGSHILVNMIWGTVFGAIFAKVFNLVPGKKILKGLCYGLIMVFITSIETNTWGTSWFAYHNEWGFALTSFLGNSTSIAQAIVFGLVLGLLYRKPPK